MDGHTFIRGLKAGRRWAALHPYAEPKTYQDKALAFLINRGSDYSSGWLDGVMHEYWTPTLDETGKLIPSTRNI